MLKRTAFVSLALLLVTVACEKSSKSPPGAAAPTGLPPADPGAGGGMPGAAGGRPGVHGSDPHGGGMGGGDPHGGMGGGGAHGGGGMGGMASPQPGPLDPSTVLAGTIEIADALKDKVKPGDVLFLSVKPVDPATGEIIKGPPLAVDRADVRGEWPLSFQLSNQNQMVQGTKLAGNVAIVVRLDRDVDAITRQPGDLEGVLKTTPPQQALKLVIDTEIK